MRCGLKHVSDDPSANYVRALLRTSRGRLFAGTNSGLYLQRWRRRSWSAVPEIGRRIVYALGEDKAAACWSPPPVVCSRSSRQQRLDLHAHSAFVRFQDNVRAIANVGGVRLTSPLTAMASRNCRARSARCLAGSQLPTVICARSPAWARMPTSVCLIGTASAGVFFFDGKQTTTESAFEKLKGDAVWSILRPMAGLWMASGEGTVPVRAGQLKDIVPGVNARSLSISAAQTMVHARQVWCATVGNGLIKVALDDQFGAIVSRLDVEQGLPSQRVFAVLSETSAPGRERRDRRHEPRRRAL